MALNKVLVTGSSGFIGSWVVERLLADGLKVVRFDHAAPGVLTQESPHSVDLFLGDTRDATAVHEAMAHVDGFIHLAGVLGSQETIQNPMPAVETNIVGGVNVLEAATFFGVPGVNIAVGNYWESNTYSITKNTVERLIEMYVKYRGAKISNVRAFHAYGPRQSVAQPYGTSNVRKIIPSFVSRALHGDPIEIYGSGNQIADMIYVTDVADFLVDALYATYENGAAGKTIEAGTGAELTVRNVAEAVVQAVGRGEVSYLPLRQGETPDAIIQADRSTQSFVYPDGKQFVGLEEGLAQTIAYYRSQFKIEE